MTGDSCVTDSSGLPTESCIYYVNQDSNVTSSLMALPYLSSNNHFCDDEAGKNWNLIIQAKIDTLKNDFFRNPIDLSFFSILGQTLNLNIQQIPQHFLCKGFISIYKINM